MSAPRLPAPLDEPWPDMEAFLEPEDENDGEVEGCWLGRAIWAGIVATGVTVGAGVAYVVLRRFER